MKKYLIVFYNQRGPSNPVGGGIDPLLNFFESHEEQFPDWMVLFRQVVLVNSPLDAAQIRGLIRKEFRHTLFLIVESAGNTDGWLPTDAWKFLKQ